MKFIDTVETSVRKAVLEDVAALQSIGFDPSGFVAYNSTEKGITYDYTICKDTISKLTVLKDTAGELMLDIVEGPLHDILLYTDDGKIFLNGKEVIISESISSSDDLKQKVFPNVVTDYYFTTRPANYPASAYTYTGLYAQVNSLDIGNRIIDTTVSALMSILVAALTQHVFFGLITSAVLNNVTYDLKTLANSMCPDSAFMSYKIFRYTGPQNTADGSFNKFVGKFYIEEDCDNDDYWVGRTIWHIRENY